MRVSIVLVHAAAVAETAASEAIVLKMVAPVAVIAQAVLVALVKWVAVAMSVAATMDAVCSSQAGP